MIHRQLAADSRRIPTQWSLPCSDTPSDFGAKTPPSFDFGGLARGADCWRTMRCKGARERVGRNDTVSWRAA